MPEGDTIERELARCKPNMPLGQLVEEVNRIYHFYEAPHFDSIHREELSRAGEVMRLLLQELSHLAGHIEWRILDFGCGTGFEAEQLLTHLPQERVSSITCYDPQPGMVERCREKVGPLADCAVFCSERGAIPALPQGYNLLVTSQVLHHLTDVPATIRDLLHLLSDDAVWLMVHEPSRRFYDNAECLRVYDDFLSEFRWRKFLLWWKYPPKIRSALGLTPNLARLTAGECFDKKMFSKRPSDDLILALVDYQNAVHTNGLDFEELRGNFAGTWDLALVKTYLFDWPLRSHYGANLPKRWQKLCDELEKRFPLDGDHFSAIWRRI